LYSPYINAIAAKINKPKLIGRVKNILKSPFDISKDLLNSDSASGPSTNPRTIVDKGNLIIKAPNSIAVVAPPGIPREIIGIIVPIAANGYNTPKEIVDNYSALSRDCTIPQTSFALLN